MLQQQQQQQQKIEKTSLPNTLKLSLCKLSAATLMKYSILDPESI